MYAIKLKLFPDTSLINESFIAVPVINRGKSNIGEDKREIETEETRITRLQKGSILLLFYVLLYIASFSSSFFVKRV